MEKSDEIDVGVWVKDRLSLLSSGSDGQANTARGLERFRSGRRSQGARKKAFAWMGVTTAAAFGCALALPDTRVFARRCVDICLAQTGLTAQPRPGKMDFRSDIRMGHRELAPEFTLADASGRLVTLSKFRGQVVMLNFWATWCLPCQTEIPWFAEFQEKYRHRGFVAFGISLDESGWQAVRPFLDHRQINYRVMLGDDEIARSYGGIESLPATFLIDKAGRIASSYRGLATKAAYDDSLQRLMAEK